MYTLYTNTQRTISNSNSKNGKSWNTYSYIFITVTHTQKIGHRSVGRHFKMKQTKHTHQRQYLKHEKNARYGKKNEPGCGVKMGQEDEQKTSEEERRVRFAKREWIG